MKNFFNYKCIEINEDEIKSFKNESQFSKLAFEIIRETAIYTSEIATIKKRKEGWTRNEAILGAHLVRLSKLLSIVLDQASKNHQEILNILSRLIYETLLNIMFLLHQNNDEIFESFVKYSLRNDKRLWNRIEDNIQTRGEELPIERRMKESILYNFEQAEITIKEVDEKMKAPWGDKSTYKRAEDLGIEKMHLHMFSGQSHAIHGNWNDLIFYHLKRNGNYFEPDFNWSKVRPQGMLSQSLFTTNALKQYVLFLEIPIENEVINRLENLEKRISTVDALHEKFLHC
ncbi:MAG: DUF5677 domain-containing protein [Melioribacteraceae bacterium]|nr:DUF5677 domain-containing protein [Melioribacteraceae bacterium]MCF8353995.1 DUF5677 domain-containing protein [Melioribacteraceae bacterium]MCF8393723.1 DUF5677 domain-containing protein [Melioribacteraceae bacterium]MCF8419535.1 DUF5677 domain-containing protein [Melioribacteraceae bacterium]